MRHSMMSTFIPLRSSLVLAVVCGLGHAQEPEPPVKKPATVDGIRVELDVAIAAYHADARKAWEALDGEIQRVIDATATLQITVEKKLERKSRLEGELRALREEKKLPSSSELEAASRKYTRSVDAAVGRCRAAFARAATEYGKSKSDLDRAQAVLDEEEKLLGKRPTPEVAKKEAVPPHVAENVRALRAHRPRYVDGVTGLNAALDSLVRAASKADAAGYRTSIASAIRAAEGGPTTNRGETNSRADVLAVLRAMERGVWDLRRLPIHRADHRTEKGSSPELTGLPGVNYGSAGSR